MTTVLSCENLTHSYRDGKNVIPVLQGIDLTVSQNDSVAIVGASGCGKSTLLHLLGGLDRPTSGVVYWQGKNVNILTERKKCQQRNRCIGFVYQFHHLLLEFSALENVALPLLIRGEKPSLAQAAARELLAAVGLEQRAHHKINELSGGERQRTAIARALVTKPSCVLADEPTGNLDRKTAEQVLQVMLGLQHRFKISFVIVSHDQNLASHLNHIYHLNDGHLQSV